MKKFFNTLIKKSYILYSLSLCDIAYADTPFGLIGGQDLTGSNPAYAAFVASSGTLTPLSPLPTTGVINSVAINFFGAGLIGGQDQPALGPVYAALVSSSGILTPLSPLPTTGVINSVAINDFGAGLIGGRDFNGIAPAYASLISSSGTLTPLSPLPTTGVINDVAINIFGTGIIGGQDLSGSQPAYAALVSSSGTATSLSPLPTVGVINSVAINNFGAGLIGGQDLGGVTPAYAALVSPSGTLIPLSPLPTTGVINDVAINFFGVGLIGGQDLTGSLPAYAALVSPSGTLTPLSPLPTNGVITSVAINDFGAGIIGGIDATGSQPAYAALVSPSGTLTPLSPLPTNGIIYSVAINDFGAGLIGGQDLAGVQPAYAALVTPSGTLIPLSPVPTLGFINGVAIATQLLSQIPTTGLSGNNLALANYINTYAPFDAFYFVPAFLDGTLSEALESVAPTRNAFSLFTADNNLFFLNSSVSRHSRDSRAFRRHLSSIITDTSEEVASNTLEQPADLLLASNSDKISWSNRKKKTPAPPPQEPPPEALPQEPSPCESLPERPYQLWGTVLGALAYQKSQHQSPAFQPTTGAAILAFDGKATLHTWVGTGAAYAYTHIHEKKDAGHININQEYLFLYALWDNCKIYFDSALWAGLFQARSARDIHMTGFEFTSKAHIKGWQLAPHAELGYDFNSDSRMLTFEPFVMVDWISNWQQSYKEKGSGPFNMGQKHHYSSFLRSETGIRFYETVSFTHWNLGFEEKLSYVNKKPFKVGTINAFIVGAPGSFTIETLTTTQNLGVAEAELIFEPKNAKYPYGTIAYQGEFGSMYQSHVVSLNINWNF